MYDITRITEKQEEMEHFYDDDFERYLKEQADQFKMEPTKKVWHGIYNNFHPGRRWPSAASGLMIILLLTLTNNLNTRQQREMDEKAFTERVVTKSLKPGHNKIVFNGLSKKDIAFDNYMIEDLLQLGQLNKSNENISSENNTSDNLIISGSADSRSPSAEIQHKSLNTDAAAILNVPGSVKVNTAQQQSTSGANIIDQVEVVNSSNGYIINSFVDIPKAELSSHHISGLLSASNESSISKIFKKLKRPSRWNFYVSPTMNFRTLGKAATASTISNPSASFANQPNMGVSVNNTTIQHVAPGFEAGASTSLPITTRLQFFSGLQLNYSGYNITASHTHPVVASIQVLNNGNSQTLESISYYTNDRSQAQTTLHSYQIEASVPLGINYKLIDNDKLTLNIISAFEPSIVLKEKSYLLSTDTHNYISYPQLQRNMNINSEVGAFLGFNMGKLKYGIGPEMRYQLLSNFKKSAPYSEHLINYGLRLSVTK